MKEINEIKMNDGSFSRILSGGGGSSECSRNDNFYETSNSQYSVKDFIDKRYVEYLYESAKSKNQFKSTFGNGYSISYTSSDSNDYTNYLDLAAGTFNCYSAVDTYINTSSNSCVAKRNNSAFDFLGSSYNLDLTDYLIFYTMFAKQIANTEFTPVENPDLDEIKEKSGKVEYQLNNT